MAISENVAYSGLYEYYEALGCLIFDLVTIDGDSRNSCTCIWPVASISYIYPTPYKNAFKILVIFFKKNPPKNKQTPPPPKKKKQQKAKKKKKPKKTQTQNPTNP